ncbi:DUF4262 domain-containing protein [Yinghuangia seranimata]|nr:DUF4262 domain-containing protein [Yinghuangia seranimata]
MLCRPADARAAEPPWLSVLGDRLAAAVRDYGWTVVAAQGGEQQPAFAHTVGIHHTLRRPELALLGLPVEVMHPLLNDVASGIRDGAPTADGTRVEGLLAGGLPLALKQVDAGWYPVLFGSVLHFHRTAVPVLQVVWTDPAGLFPWDEGFAPKWLAEQPRLWIPPGR